jgi:hypothetical protein
MVKKKHAKTILDITTTSMIGAGGAIALGGIGGTSATHGQAGIAGATRFMPMMGTMAGTGMMMDTMKGLNPKKRRRKR